MLGAILGDIIGSRFEFSVLKKNKSEKFNLLTDKNYFTDDTVMTIATADAILNNKSFEESYNQWGYKYPNAGYGGMFEYWLKQDIKKPYNSFGNGSAMRVSPVGWFYNDLDEVKKVAEKTALCTHNHKEGIIGAVVVASCIYLARVNTPKSEIKKVVEYFGGSNYYLNKTIEQIRPNYKFDVTCQGSVPEAIICFLEGNNYEDVVRKAVSLGGDTDTQACIAGSIAEAYYGVPDEYVIKLDDYLPDDMLDIIVQFNNKLKGVY